MQFPVHYILLLLEQASQQAGTSLEHAQLGRLSEAINALPREPSEPKITSRYLYEYLLSNCQRARKEGASTIGVSPPYLNRIAKYVQCRDFKDFVARQQQPPDPRLETCIGTWYSYVRENSGLPHILRAPVRIWNEDNRYYMELQGPHRTFVGPVQRRGTCLFAQLIYEPEKELNLVFKLGNAKVPELLQGVFSGVSTNGDPIAGREILVRQAEIPIAELHTRKFNIRRPEEIADELDPRIVRYFEDFEQNYVKITQVSTYTLDDLLMGG